MDWTCRWSTRRIWRFSIAILDFHPLAKWCRLVYLCIIIYRSMACASIWNFGWFQQLKYRVHDSYVGFTVDRSRKVMGFPRLRTRHYLLRSLLISGSLFLVTGCTSKSCSKSSPLSHVSNLLHITKTAAFLMFFHQISPVLSPNFHGFPLKLMVFLQKSSLRLWVTGLQRSCWPRPPGGSSTAWIGDVRRKITVI